MGDLELTFLGTGTSLGVPSIGCGCETCLSQDPRDKRLRSSVFMQSPDASWVVDTGPDLRSQCLREGITHLDAALITHAHTDHIMGFDDLRRFTFGVGKTLPIHATGECMDDLKRIFAFAFNGENRYRGYLKPAARVITGPFFLGETEVTPLPVEHGKVKTIGFLFSRAGKKLIAYIPDVKTISPEAMEAMKGVDTLIIDALRITVHPTHKNFEESIATAVELKPRQTWFTHFSCDVMHAREEASLPPGIRLAFDGLKIRV